MNLYSHATVANRICKETFPLPKRLIVILGSLMPDLNPLTQPHRSKNLLIRIFNNQNRIQKSKFEVEKSFRLGILLHYICDYFCYAHRYDLDISHGVMHIQYEKELHKLLKEGYEGRLDHDVEIGNVMTYILEARGLYDEEDGNLHRDLKFILTITERVTQDLSVNFRKLKTVN